MAFYYGDACLGETSAVAVGELDYGDLRAVVYDYLTRDFTLEDLASFIIDAEVFPTLRELAEDALDNLAYWADQGHTMDYGGVEYLEDGRISNRRPKASQCRRNGTSGKKASGKKTTKPKASGKRPAARSAPRRS